MKKLYSLFIAFALVFSLCAGAFANDEKKIEFHAFDVGQGDSLFFLLPDGETVLIDGGTRESGKRVVSYLHNLDVRQIDLLIATHPHEDHIGGLRDVMNAFPVGKVWDAGYNLGTATQRHFLETVQHKKIPFSMPKAGYSEMIGEVRFDVLAPVRLVRSKAGEANNNSMIVHVSWKNVSFLLMGDAELDERKTLKNFPRSTVLKLSHHGSSDGTNPFLLRNVKPKIAVASYAAGNPYGHPHKEVVKMLKDNNIPLYATASGNVVITSDGEKAWVSK